ncbi:MAG: threonine ammonia-lyase, partial [Clostridia bacterium]
MTEVDISLADVVDAAERLGPYVDPTPVIRSPWLSERTGAEVYLKCENLQRTGSFKIRGALSKLLTLSAAERTAGVITASAGNHAQGVAYGSRLLGLSALIVVPKSTPAVKQAGIRRYGADLVLAGPHYDEAHEEAVRLQRETGRTYIHAYLDPVLIAGQGTVAWETLRHDPAWDTVIVPAGGGGLVAGVGTVVK